MKDRILDILNRTASHRSSGSAKEVKVGDYQTSFFFVCPSAAELYKDIESKVDETDLGIATSAARFQDILFYLEDMLIEKHGSATEKDVMMFEVLAEEIMDLGGMIGLREEHSYIMDVHVPKIRDLKKSK